MSSGEKVTLCMPFNGSYLPLLSIPPNEIARLSIRPLKWLRYLSYAIYGREGSISSLSNGGDIQDYDAPLQHQAYYFHSDETPLWIDPFAMDGRTTDSSALIRCGGFREAVVARDESCVVTQVPASDCEAAHIIPHSKGSKYIAKLHPHRCIGLQPLLDDIDDVRNGILLWKGLRFYFGRSGMAFLRTPNFAMATTDVPVAASNSGPKESRVTMQFFIEHWKSLPIAYLDNADARLDSGSPDYPTGLLLDCAYACAALKQWANEDSVKTLQNLVEGFYDNGDEIVDDEFIGDDDPGNDDNINDDPRDSNSEYIDNENGNGGSQTQTPLGHHHASGTRAKQRQQAQKHKANKNDDNLSIHELVLAYWAFNARKARVQVRPDVASDSNSVREKVEKWREAVE